MKRRKLNAADYRATLGAFLTVFDEPDRPEWADAMVSNHGAAAATNSTSTVSLRDGPTRDDQAGGTRDYGGHRQGQSTDATAPQPAPHSLGPRNASNAAWQTTKVAVGNSLSVCRQGAERDQ